ncbi:iron ABC transporter permease [bacterium 210820-DFI.6.37]|nr:iron ABC transporter permease [bacterium 210820-DFI.6.37]
MRIGLKETVKQQNLDERPYKQKLRLMILIAIAVLLFSLCLKTIEKGMISPVEVMTNYKAWIHINLGKWFDWPIYLRRSQVIADLPSYYDSVNRLKITVITFVCGAMLSMSGSLFQSVFRNPMAAPTMLGVNTGVNLGILILVLRYSWLAATMPFEKYLYCYIGAMIMLGLVLAAGKLSSGKNKFSVFDLLIVGSILSQVVGAIRSYFTFSMDNDQVLLLNEITNAISVNTENISFLFLGGAVLICMVPVYLIRFSFNAVCFDNDEAKSFGINTAAMKLITLLLGSFMITAAMIHCGTVGMVTLIAPFISRAIFGAEFRKVFWGNILIGGTILVLCRDIASMIYFTAQGLPIGTVVDFVAVPIFVVIMVTQRRVWE